MPIALFLFDAGEPIGEEGLLQLKAHVAASADGNNWTSIDKPSNLDLGGRVAWTDEHLDELRSIGEAVLRGDDPAKLDWALKPVATSYATFAKPSGDLVSLEHDSPKAKALTDPYQFLAACIELVQALNEGPGFKTRLPIKFDATCSALQHLSAITRDEKGGGYVNLVPSSEPEDFYKRVAFKTWDANPDLRDLFEGPLDRDLAKQPAMTYFYGSSGGGFKQDKLGRYHPQGMTEQVIEELKRRGKLTKGVKRRAKELAHAFFRTIEGMAPGAKGARDFLQRLAWIAAKKHNKPIRWTTALGLPVINCNYKPDIRTISVPLNGHRRRTNVVVGDTDEMLPAGAKNAIAANFTHSHDAAHLQLIALKAGEEAISFVSVHDCIAGSAPRAGRLHEIAAQQFVWLHTRCGNPLAGVLTSAQRDLPKSAALPVLPPLGNLKIEGVLKSLFFFKPSSKGTIHNG